MAVKKNLRQREQKMSKTLFKRYVELKVWSLNEHLETKSLGASDPNIEVHADQDIIFSEFEINT